MAGMKWQPQTAQVWGVGKQWQVVDGRCDWRNFANSYRSTRLSGVSGLTLGGFLRRTCVPVMNTTRYQYVAIRTGQYVPSGDKPPWER